MGKQIFFIFLATNLKPTPLDYVIGVNLGKFSPSYWSVPQAFDSYWLAECAI
jgi:hypothetical protein